jgi:hypothetical protein
VALSFDKLDVEKGMEVRGPGGELRWLKQPWSILAFQIAGADGLCALHADGKDEERETPPAEPLLVELLARGDHDLNAVVLWTAYGGPTWTATRTSSSLSSFPHGSKSIRS